MPVGCTNSQRRLKSEPPTAVERGIDTWRLVRYLDSDRDLQLVRSFMPPSGIAPERVVGHRLDFWPGHRLLALEGHPAVEALGDPAELVDAREAVLRGLDDHGLPRGDDGGIGRLDLTTTLDFGDPQRGLVFLSGLATVDVPRRQLEIRRAPGNGPVQTVAFRGPSGRSILSRAYDKGVERAARGDLDRSAPAGSLVRLEGQNRFARSARMRAEVFATNPETCEALFNARFAPVAASAEGLTAATTEVLVDELRERVRTGTVKPAAAERMIGFLGLQGIGLSRATRARRRKELREHGLVLADPLSEPVSVDLAEGIEAAVEAWSG